MLPGLVTHRSISRRLSFTPATFLTTRHLKAAKETERRPMTVVQTAILERPDASGPTARTRAKPSWEGGKQASEANRAGNAAYICVRATLAIKHLRQQDKI